MNALRRVCSLLLAGLAFPFSNLLTQPSPTQPLVEGNTAFSCDFYALLKSTQGNLFFSPYSISTCSAIAYAGARGNTEQEMARVLHLVTNQEQVHAAFSQLQCQLNQAQKQKGYYPQRGQCALAPKRLPFPACLPQVG